MRDDFSSPSANQRKSLDFHVDIRLLKAKVYFGAIVLASKSGSSHDLGMDKQVTNGMRVKLNSLHVKSDGTVVDATIQTISYRHTGVQQCVSVLWDGASKPVRVMLKDIRSA